MVVACSGFSGASLFRDADMIVVNVDTRGYPRRRLLEWRGLAGCLSKDREAAAPVDE